MIGFQFVALCAVAAVPRCSTKMLVTWRASHIAKAGWPHSISPAFHAMKIHLMHIIEACSCSFGRA
jgi:hypothetical protein